ncbi:MAG: hypothetical protein ACRCU2_02645, partial [Planktothrix sp.]
RIFLELTQLGEGAKDTPRRVFKSELIPPEYSEQLIDRTLQKLVEARLVVTDCLRAWEETGVSGDKVVHMAHESLIRNWPQLRGWLEENREILRRQRAEWMRRRLKLD